MVLYSFIQLHVAHDADTIHDFMEAVFQKFGVPDYMVGDGERGLIGAVREYYSDIPYQYCHRHFLDNMGKSLMEFRNLG